MGDTGLFYDAYLKEVIAVLEKDEEFRNKMANVNFEDVKVATFSKELNTVAKHVRDELDTLKRKAQMSEGKKINHKALIDEMAGHLDHSNADTFQAKDLELLINQATTDLKNYDVERHESFKQYEMQKALEEELEMQKMNDFEKKQFLEEKRQQLKKHNKHEKMPHPM